MSLGLGLTGPVAAIESRCNASSFEPQPMLDARHRHIAKVLAHQFQMPVASVEEVLSEKDTWATLQSFFTADGEPTRVMFFKQPREVVGEEAEMYEQPDDADAELFLTTGERKKGRAVYFIRLRPREAVGSTTLHTDLSFGVVGPNSLEHLQVRCVASHPSPAAAAVAALTWRRGRAAAVFCCRVSRLARSCTGKPRVNPTRASVSPSPHR